MQDLRDKLLKAGLVTDEQAKHAESNKQRPRRDDRPRTDRPHTDRPHNDRPHNDRPRDARSGPRSDRPHERRDARPHGGHRPANPGTAGHKPEAGPRIPKLPPLPGSREYQRLESRKQLETDRKLLELAKTNEVVVEAGEQTFYFVTRKGRLRRLELSPAQAAKLESGELAIVERREPSQIEHALVPPAIAEQMRALSEKAVRFLNTPGSAVGFMSDAELEAKKAEEAARGPEESEESSEDAQASAESEATGEPQTESTETAAEAAAGESSTASEPTGTSDAPGEPTPS